MKNRLKEQYAVSNPMIESVNRHLGLKHNEEYIDRVDQTLLQLSAIFYDEYNDKGVRMGVPRGREKSIKSIFTKKKILEIKRLYKLYIEKQITDEEIIRLKKIINSISMEEMLELEIKVREEIEKGEIGLINNPVEYLKLKDVMAICLTVGAVDDVVGIEDEKLNEILQNRKSSTVREDYKKYNEMARKRVAKIWTDNLINNKQLLDKLNLELLENGYVHREKANGYSAEHVKFRYKDKPEYMFELQIKSIHQERLSKKGAPADHERRLGKKRLIPDTKNKKTFIMNLLYTLPGYRAVTGDREKLELKKYSMLENTICYYDDYLDPKTEQYSEIMQIIREEEERAMIKI